MSELISRPAAALGARPGRLAAAHLLRPGRAASGSSCPGSASPTGWTRPATCWSTSWTSSRATPVDLALAKAHPGHWVTPGLGAGLLAGRRGGDAWTGPAPSRRPCSARRTPSRRRRAETRAGLLAAPAGPAAGRTADRRAPWTTRWRSGRSPTSTPPCRSPGWPWPGGTRSGSSPRPTWSRRPGPARRRLVRPSDPWTTARTALVEPLLGGGSTVVVAGPADAERLAEIAAQERVGRPRLRPAHPDQEAQPPGDVGRRQHQRQPQPGGRRWSRAAR